MILSETIDEVLSLINALKNKLELLKQKDIKRSVYPTMKIYYDKIEYTYKRKYLSQEESDEYDIEMKDMILDLINTIDRYVKIINISTQINKEKL